MTEEAGTDALVEMRRIGKAFGGVRALDGVPFDLRPGEVHVLAGENGAGKSTLIRILCGVHPEYDGEVRLSGQTVRFRSPHDAFLRGISVIHQEMSLIPTLSVVDNIFLGRERTRGVWLDRAAQAAEARVLLASLGLGLDIRAPVGELPLSVQQMVEVAKAMSIDARVFVMDEPTATLSEPEVNRLFDLIATLKRKGCGIVFITHRMEEVYRIGDRITVLRDGRYVNTARAADLPQRELVRWMVGRELNQQFPVRASGPGRERLRVNGFSVADPQGSQRLVVRDASFTAAAGEIVGFAGLHGSGNGALFRGLFGAYGRLARGDVRLDGAALPVRSPARSLRSGLALLTNDRKAEGLVLGMSVAHNMTLASLRSCSPGGWLRPGAEDAVAERHRETLNIRLRSPRQDVGELSGGNQQKVVLAKWLETRPKVLLLEEPTRGVDVGAKHEIYELMNRWTAEGIAILLITSELTELLALSDRIFVMHRGRISAEFSRADATPEKIGHAAMGEGGEAGG